MAFNQFDRAGHRVLSTEISKKLTALGQRLGVTFSVGGGSIGSTSLVMKITATASDPTVALASKAQAFAREARFLGLEASDFGGIFVSQGKRYKVTAISLSRPKYPISGECQATGKSYKFGRHVVPLIVAGRPAAVAPSKFAAPAPSNEVASGVFEAMF